MKIFAFVDLHGNFSILKQIIEQIKMQKPELILCCGDFTNWGQDSDKVLSHLDKLNLPVLVVFGNHETNEMINKAEIRFKNIVNLHKRFYHYKNYLFVGFGGGGFGSRDVSLEIFSKKIKKEFNKYRDCEKILLTHRPPYNTSLDIVQGYGHTGDKTLTNLLRNSRFNYLFCGHLHENAKKTDILNKTIIINPGPDGEFIEI